MELYNIVLLIHNFLEHMDVVVLLDNKTIYKIF